MSGFWGLEAFKRRLSYLMTGSTGQFGERSVSGFWSSETLKRRLPHLIEGYREERVVNCAYELTMGHEIFVGGTKNGVRRSIGDGEQFSIPPGHFAHLLTEETVEIPPDALGLISMKSRLKMRGLVNVSGFHVDPGFRGRLLFSVYNAGSQDHLISQGTEAFLLWYSSLDRETEDLYEGARSDTVTIPDNDSMAIQGEVYTPQALTTRVAALERSMSHRRSLVLVLVGAIVGAAVGALLTFALGSAFGGDTKEPNSEPGAQVDANPTLLGTPNETLHVAADDLDPILTEIVDSQGCS